MLAYIILYQFVETWSENAMLEIIIKTIKRKMVQMMNHIKEYGYQDDYDIR